ncbi:RDD family protein [Kribbella sp. NPDC058245]|uniref:RDD family protein n=1 Tax=Kribbella sp. NPDC058245 TaxID=3346399 RepID=UPI0036E6FF3D
MVAEKQAGTASVGRRVVQGLIDRLLSVATGFVLAIPVVIVLQKLGVAADPVAQAAAGTWVGGLVVAAVLNEVVLPSRTGGSTLGMRMTRLKVIRLDGSAPGVTHYLIRYVLWVVDGLVWAVVALVVILCTPHRQRVGDLAAGTIVVSADEVVLPGPDGELGAVAQTELALGAREVRLDGRE